MALQVQWVEGNATKAEDSFLKINQSATKISDAELELIKNRDKAFAIASRAIVRAGKGYQYWSSFDGTSQKQILNFSQKIHEIMFGSGTYNSNDINSFSIGGAQSSNLTLDVVTQTVKISNDIVDNKNMLEGTDANVIKCLESTLRLLQYINSKEPFSLGIHPFVYFYSDIGKHKIGSYYGFLLFMKELIKKKKLDTFIEIRGKFEQVIYQYSFLIQQIIRKSRQSKKAYTPIKDYFMEIMNIIHTHKEYSVEEVITQLKRHSDFRYLQTEIVDNDSVDVKSNFSRGQKQQIKLYTFISSLSKCPICNGYLDNKSISVDHIVRKEDGGTNSLHNGQITHLYCNTTYKN